ncbi:MAG: hypothetical protein PHZ19_07320 [Candidatus Thermoplasmatota archaeon]|nr:hypothetical protein [Candidatus Thermoplasmatota archaeon]
MREWLSGQRASAKVIQEERVKFLVSLTPDRALEIYLGLATAGQGEPSQRPSPVLLSMRRAVARLGHR